MKLYTKEKSYELYNGDILDMKEVIKDNSIDSIVCDPPYELNFMNKGWDNSGSKVFNEGLRKYLTDVFRRQIKRSKTKYRYSKRKNNLKWRKIKMKLHELKIKEEYMRDVASGIKPFELRKNDRDFQVGDLIRFIVVDRNHTETDSEQTSEQPVCYYDENTLYRITYVLKNVPQYGLDKDYCILGIEKLNY